MTYLSQRISSFNTGTLSVVKSILSSSSFSDIARNGLVMIDRRLAELASDTIDVPNASIPSAWNLERLRTLLISIFPEPEEARRIESLLVHGAGLSGETVSQFIRETCSQ